MTRHARGRVPARLEGRDTDPDGVPDAGATLRRVRAMLGPALRAALARLDDITRAQAGYHLGLTDPDGAPGGGGGGGGKAVRPTLAVLGAEAAGARADAGLPGGVAVELVHNFSLVHDDLIDGDLRRRDRSTVWARWGMPSAVLTGDAMQALAHEVVLESGSAHTARAAALLAATTRELIHGQAQDIAFERRDPLTDPVGVEECLAMAAGKTASLLATSAEIGALLAGGSPAVCAALRAFGGGLGTAFQLVDDLLGIWGEPAVTGKPVLSDLRSRKKSLPVTFAVQHGGEPGRALARWLATPPPAGRDDDELDLRRAAALVEAGGGRTWAATEARRRMVEAQDALDGVDLPDPTRAELLALGRHLVEREF